MNGSHELYRRPIGFDRYDPRAPHRSFMHAARVIRMGWSHERFLAGERQKESPVEHQWGRHRGSRSRARVMKARPAQTREHS